MKTWAGNKPDVTHRQFPTMANQCEFFTTTTWTMCTGITECMHVHAQIEMIVIIDTYTHAASGTKLFVYPVVYWMESGTLVQTIEN